jgi:hypothetical protein
LSAGYREVAGPIPSMVYIKVFKPPSRKEGSAPVHLGILASEPLTPTPLDYVPSSLSLALTTKADTNVTEAYLAVLQGLTRSAGTSPQYMQEDLPATTEVRTHQCRCGHLMMPSHLPQRPECCLRRLRRRPHTSRVGRAPSPCSLSGTGL